jgi:hypothetical protein
MSCSKTSIRRLEESVIFGDVVSAPAGGRADSPR